MPELPWCKWRRCALPSHPGVHNFFFYFFRRIFSGFLSKKLESQRGPVSRTPMGPFNRQSDTLVIKNPLEIIWISWFRTPPPLLELVRAGPQHSNSGTMKMGIIECWEWYDVTNKRFQLTDRSPADVSVLGGTVGVNPLDPATRPRESGTKIRKRPTARSDVNVRSSICPFAQLRFGIFVEAEP